VRSLIFITTTGRFLDKQEISSQKFIKNHEKKWPKDRLPLPENGSGTFLGLSENKEAAES
jgi:hypothetical protein